MEMNKKKIGIIAGAAAVIIVLAVVLFFTLHTGKPQVNETDGPTGTADAVTTPKQSGSPEFSFSPDASDPVSQTTPAPGATSMPSGAGNQQGGQSSGKGTSQPQKSYIAPDGEEVIVDTGDGIDFDSVFGDEAVSGPTARPGATSKPTAKPAGGKNGYATPAPTKQPNSGGSGTLLEDDPRIQEDEGGFGEWF